MTTSILRDIFCENEPPNMSDNEIARKFMKITQWLEEPEQCAAIISMLMSPQMQFGYTEGFPIKDILSRWI